MPGQMFATSGDPRLRRKKGRTVADVNAQLGLLPGMLQAETAREQQEQTAQFRSDTLAQEKKALGQQKDIAKEQLKLKREAGTQALGLGASKFGMTALTKDFGMGIGKKSASAVANAQGPEAGGVGGQTGGGGFFSNINVGGAVQGAAGGGVLGYGLGTLLKKPKIGAALGMIGGGLWGGGLLDNAFSSIGGFLGSIGN